MGKYNSWCSSGISIGPIVFLIYIDLPNTVNDETIPILFYSDTRILDKSPDIKDFQTNMITVVNCVNKWFKANLLSINVNKTHYIQFKTKNKQETNIHVVCNDLFNNKSIKY
jgi:hypothetical protein